MLVQIVRSLQAKVTAHLEAWRSAGGLDRPRVAEELEDQAQVPVVAVPQCKSL
jgi:hypothetical protein